jgi:CheY-like chemotaxis protein
MTYTILLVDDNKEILDLFSDALTRLGGYNVVCAADGHSGLTQACALRPDCIIIDILLPELDGYQLVRVLRGDPTTAEIPLVILTALTQEKDRFTGLASGADRYLVKPVSLPELVVAIREAIATSEEERATKLRSLAENEDS